MLKIHFVFVSVNLAKGLGQGTQMHVSTWLDWQDACRKDLVALKMLPSLLNYLFYIEPKMILSV